MYGYGILGRHFRNECIQSKVTVEYIIDRQKEGIHTNVPVYLPEEVFPEVELMVVTAVYDYDEIYKKLKEKNDCRVISLETLIFEEEL